MKAGGCDSTTIEDHEYVRLVIGNECDFVFTEVQARVTGAGGDNCVGLQTGLSTKTVEFEPLTGAGGNKWKEFKLCLKCPTPE